MAFLKHVSVWTTHEQTPTVSSYLRVTLLQSYTNIIYRTTLGGAPARWELFWRGSGRPNPGITNPGQ